jgi:methylated-DNA-[protein]-cysteine S-methyltransferase
MPEMLYTTLHSPIGELLLAGDDSGLQILSMQDAPRARRIGPEWRRDDAAFAHVRHQLEEYFAGSRDTFEIGLSLRGNAFEQRVWAELLKIPYGETASYGQIGASIGAPSAARAVGLANGRNPVAVIVPCHRVIGANGSLTGYGGGLERKRYLLDLESGVRSLLPA